MKTKVILSKNCGLCFGSRRAIDMVLERAKSDKNLVVRGALLHNERVQQTLNEYGVGRKDNLQDFTKDDVFVVRAHGEPKKTYDEMQSRGIEIFDCTCPSVKAIHKIVETKSGEGYTIILLGNCGKKTGKLHAEVAGIKGWSKSKVLLIEDEIDAKNAVLDGDKYFLVVQTTFPKDLAEKIIDYFKKKCADKKIEFDYRNTCCLAQKNINLASLDLAKEVDIVLVVGGKESNNSIELYRNVLTVNKNCYFVTSLEDVKSLKKQGVLKEGKTYGLTAGASTMQESIIEIKEFLENNLE